jgi:hypothetical protein
MRRLGSQEEFIETLDALGHASADCA